MATEQFLEFDSLRKNSLHISHLDVSTNSAVNTFMISTQGPFRDQCLGINGQMKCCFYDITL